MTRTEQQRAESFRVLADLLEQGALITLYRSDVPPMVHVEIAPPSNRHRDTYWLDGGSLDACLAQLPPTP